MRSVRQMGAAPRSQNFQIDGVDVRVVSDGSTRTTTTAKRFP